MDGLTTVRGGVLARLVHLDGEPVELRAAQPSAHRVVLGARAERADLAREGLVRWRAALGVDDDLRPFYDRFRDDPLIGASVRRRPWLRIRRRPVAFEALAFAVTEQLIEFERAVRIQRRLVHRWGPAGPEWALPGLRDSPSAAVLAGLAPVQLEACDLAAARAIALVRVAREVARGRVDLDGSDHERGWTRLRAIPGIGAWTVEMLATTGQGRLDQVPAGDLGFLKVVGRIESGGNPAARASEEAVRALLARYGEWQGLAGAHLIGTPSPLAGALLTAA